MLKTKLRRKELKITVKEGKETGKTKQKKTETYVQSDNNAHAFKYTFSKSYPYRKRSPLQ